MLLATLTHLSLIAAALYFPPPDVGGGWRKQQGGNDSRFDTVFEYIQGTARHGGLLVVRKGRLVYERYYGWGHREAAGRGIPAQ